MKNLISFLPWPFGPKRPEFYLCKCDNCRFMQIYEVSDCTVISLDEKEKDPDAAFVQVKALPQNCPECGRKMKKTKIQSPIKY